MKGNAYTGDAPVTRRDGSVWRLNFDYAARAALKTEFGTIDGKAATDLEVAAKLDEFMRGDLDALARITVIALQRNHRGVTLAEVMRESLPQVPAMTALMQAMSYAVGGGEGPAKPDTGPPAAGAAPRRARPATRSPRR